MEIKVRNTWYEGKQIYTADTCPMPRNDMGENIWAYYMTRGKLKKTDTQMAEEAVTAW